MVASCLPEGLHATCRGQFLARAHRGTVLSAWLRTVPSPSMLVCWHEAVQVIITLSEWLRLG